MSDPSPPGKPVHLPPPHDRAMTPDMVATEITNGTTDRAWVLRAVPRHCRVPVNTRPPLFWESRVSAWWTRQEPIPWSEEWGQGRHDHGLSQTGPSEHRSREICC